jgi:hypothetical protein
MTAWPALPVAKTCRDNSAAIPCSHEERKSSHADLEGIRGLLELRERFKKS